LLISPHAFAQSPPQGFNSVGDVAPFGAHGATIMDIYNDNNGHQGVGINIGTGQPQAMLDVAGGIKPGSSIPGTTVQASQPCISNGVAPGTLAYSGASTGDQILYCSASSGNWQSAFGGGDPPGTWCGITYCSSNNEAGNCSAWITTTTCQGAAPGSSCPPGYTRTAIAAGTSGYPIGYNSNGFYICAKN
jgi:hypothetical protein